MADDNEKQAKGGSSKKLIIIIVIVALIAIGASVGVTWFLLSGSDGEEAEQSETTQQEVKVPAEYYAFKDPLIVTYDVGGRQRYLQVSITLMSRSTAVLDAIELHNPVVRNRLLNLFGSKEFESLQTHEGRLALQEEATAAINDVLVQQNEEGTIEEVLFTNYVLQ